MENLAVRLDAEFVRSRCVSFVISDVELSIIKAESKPTLHSQCLCLTTDSQLSADANCSQLVVAGI